MSKKTWIIIIIAVIVLIVIIVVIKKKSSKASAPTQQVVYQQTPAQGGNKGAGFMNFLGFALPVVLDNLNKPKTPAPTATAPPTSNMAGAPTSFFDAPNPYMG